MTASKLRKEKRGVSRASATICISPAARKTRPGTAKITTSKYTFQPGSVFGGECRLIAHSNMIMTTQIHPIHRRSITIRCLRSPTFTLVTASLDAVYVSLACYVLLVLDHAALPNTTGSRSKRRRLSAARQLPLPICYPHCPQLNGSQTRRTAVL